MRKNHPKKIFAVLICLLGTLLLTSQTLPPKKELSQKIDALAQQYVDLGIFSGVVLVAKKGKPVYHKAFGLADRENETPNTIHTRFDIGSMNKTFTKVVLLQLVQEGKIKLEDPLGKFLEGFDPRIGQKVTVGHLMEHSSGFGDYHGPQYFDLAYEEKTLSNIVDLIKQLPLLFEPGAQREYSNAGYVLLGAIIEKATGNDFYTVVEERIVKPLGLKNTFLREKYKTPQRAIGYTTTMRGNVESNDHFQQQPLPDGGFYSSTLDILKFYREYHYGNKLLDKKARALDPMHRFLTREKDTGGAIPHAGGFPGANTVHYEILRDQISVLVFANMDEPVAEDLGAGILAIIRGKEPKKPLLPAHIWIYQSLKEKGTEYVKENFDKLSQNWHPADPKDWILNMIGYNLLQSGIPGELEEAIAAFKLNTELFPDIANTWDSLGEAYLKKGNKKMAKKYYQKALELDPSLPSALEAMKQLK